MSSTWPQNTIWLSGRWTPEMARWQWDDGTATGQLDWAEGEPSSFGDQEREPRLCMVADGRVRDTDPPYSFGVFCEASSQLGEARGALDPTVTKGMMEDVAAAIETDSWSSVNSIAVHTQM